MAEAALLLPIARAAEGSKSLLQPGASLQGVWLGITRGHVKDGRKQAVAGHIVSERAAYEEMLRLLKAQVQEGIAKPVA